MALKKGTKIAIGIVGGLFIGTITVVAIIFFLILLFFTGGPAKVTRNIDKYEETMAEYQRPRGVRTEFAIFPDTILESAKADGNKPDFYFSFQNTFSDPTCEVYLKCHYSDDDYNSELERLKEIKRAGNPIIYQDSDRFIGPSYITIDHNDYSYEYALDLGDNSIAYIYTAYKCSIRSVKKIPKEYLPSDFEESLTFENGN